MTVSKLGALSGTRMQGKGELWLDPLGNEPKHGDCSISIDGDTVSYEWSYDGKPQSGKITLREGGADWSDTWHHAKPMGCSALPGSWALFDVNGTYGAGEGPDWGWRTTLSQRPSGELVLQMVNVTPWGEHGRAVRMVFAKE
jgi:hypothetical protein